MLKNVFGIAGTALNAQTIRLNTTASNLANAGSVSGSEEEAYLTKRPVFLAMVDQAYLNACIQNLGGVKVNEIVDTADPVRQVHDPGNLRPMRMGLFGYRMLMKSPRWLKWLLPLAHSRTTLRSSTQRSS